jgi:hypothetical protein
MDQIDFANGEGPIDVIRNKAWINGDTSKGKAWQWHPKNRDATAMDFTMLGTGSPAVTSVTGSQAGGSTTATTGAGSAGLYPGAADQLDLSTVKWLHRNVSQWPVTSQLTDVRIGAEKITLEHTRSGRWPTLKTESGEIEGNPWVFVNRGGQWYGATYEWLRKGQVTKNISGDELGAYTKKEPLTSWTPQPGELVGFMVSTPARTGESTVNERSNVVTVRWPA